MRSLLRLNGCLAGGSLDWQIRDIAVLRPRRRLKVKVIHELRWTQWVGGVAKCQGISTRRVRAFFRFDHSRIRHWLATLTLPLSHHSLNFNPHAATATATASRHSL